jgi:hypothetical protein
MLGHNPFAKDGAKEIKTMATNISFTATLIIPPYIFIYA